MPREEANVYGGRCESTRECATEVSEPRWLTWLNILESPFVNFSVRLRMTSVSCLGDETVNGSELLPCRILEICEEEARGAWMRHSSTALAG